MFDTETINSMISALSSIKDNADKKLMWHIVDLIQKKAKFTFVSLYLVDKDNEFVLMKSGSGRAGEMMMKKGGHKWRLEFNPAVINPVGPTVYLNQMRFLDYDLLYITPDVPDSIWQLIAPLRMNGQVVGALSVEGSEKLSFSLDDTEKFQIVADEVSRLLVKFNLIW